MNVIWFVIKEAKCDSRSSILTSVQILSYYKNTSPINSSANYGVLISSITDNVVGVFGGWAKRVHFFGVLLFCGNRMKKIPFLACQGIWSHLELHVP
jgi:hypothetical protein